MMDNSTRWVRVICRVCPIQRNKFATDFHPVATTRSADVPHIMLLATSKEWAISGHSTGASNCDYGAIHTELAWHLSADGCCFFLWCAQSKTRTTVLVTQTWCMRSIGAGIEAFFLYRSNASGIGWYRVPDASIGLTLQMRCQYRVVTWNELMNWQ